MANIGIIGLGMMGRTHYEAYQKIPGAKVVAIADSDPKRAAGDLSGTGGNILKGGLTQLPMDKIKGYTDYHQLFADKNVEVIDICVPTTIHPEIAEAALKTGKHVMCEKPLGRTLADAMRIAKAAEQSSGLFMPAMCIRFWPEWAWAKQAIADKRYGKVVSASCRRVASMPGGWYKEGKLSGGAILDLHIHDIDFILYLFGKPNAVFSRGYSKTSGAIDHVNTQYIYENGPMVAAEGSWCMADGFGFSMRYTINFEKATADYDLARPDTLMVSQNGKAEAIKCAAETGYEAELRYFHECVTNKKKPSVVTAADGVEGLRICEAELRSIETGQVVKVDSIAAKA